MTLVVCTDICTLQANPVLDVMNPWAFPVAAVVDFNMFFFFCRYRTSVLIITFLSYTAYHLSRKPISIVKNVLNQNCSTVTPSPGVPVNVSDAYWCDWAPFSKSYYGKLNRCF